jgi:hypothetical protein
MKDKPLSQIEAYKVASWLRDKGIEIEAALKDLWKQRPSQIASRYKVDRAEVEKAAGRE